MGNPKQKWTPEEEAALRAGVDKHGAGKWRTIQKDPEFAVVLSTRSNVDLKDKWRNMNVGICGHGSRDKIPKTFSKPKGDDFTGAASGEFSAEEAGGTVDTLVSSDSSRDRKVLDPRYTEHIINAINDINDANGSNSTAIAAFIENRHPVPSNFRRLLSSKLRDMVTQGNLVKVKQNYKVNSSDITPKHGATVRGTGDRKELQKGLVKTNELVTRSFQDSNALDPLKRNLRGGSTAVEFAKLKSKTVQEAARAAVLAVAEAEAAAAAAEKAAKEAEAAEAEAEAAQIAAEIAALAARPAKKGITV